MAKNPFKTKRRNVLVEASSAIDSDELAKAVMRSLIRDASGGLKVDLSNIEGKPFKVVTNPGGGVFWGVGGCGVDV